MLATQPNIDTIAITCTFDGIEAAAHRVISQTGGMDSVVAQLREHWQTLFRGHRG